ncbi:hypothetical protein EDD22DRAFT_842732 [Suillus occidentalis]|nr:hypothetical protein EDD22DRAFT_842732 [Suillus occidentalis]
MPILILNWNPYLNWPLILSEERFRGTLLQAVYSIFCRPDGYKQLVILESSPILRSRMNEQLPYFVFRRRFSRQSSKISKKTSVSMNLRAAVSLLVWWSHESAATGAASLTLYRERTAKETQAKPLWREEAALSIYELATQRASLNSPSQEKTHSSDSQTIRKTLKRKRRSSSSESSDYDKSDDETEEQEESLEGLEATLTTEEGLLGSVQPYPLLAYACPALWTHIRSTNPRLVAIILGRSRNLPLDVKYNPVVLRGAEGLAPKVVICSDALVLVHL